MCSSRWTTGLTPAGFICVVGPGLWPKLIGDEFRWPGRSKVPMQVASARAGSMPNSDPLAAAKAGDERAFSAVVELGSDEFLP